MRKSAPAAGRKPVRKSGATASAGSRAGLDRQRVVEAAVDLLQEKGLDALSTRQLAERLGVQSPALYWHVRDKNELLGLVADAICARMRLPSKNASFRGRLEDIAWEYRRVLAAHRDAPRLFAEQAPTGPHRMKLYDVAVGAFLDGGFAPPEAIAMATFYRNYLLGMVAEETRQSWSAHPGALRPAAALGVELARLGHESLEYPNLRGAAGLLARIEPEQLFRLGLKVLLDGMECRQNELARSVPAKHPRSSPPRRKA
jgi:TetR/AcrR family tetracycline transcriptional repressor